MADANKLDMSLDDLVTSNKKPRHRRRGGAGGPQRQRGGAAPNAVNRTNAAPALDPGAKLLVSNLHFNVTEDDLKELFSSVGPLKKASLAYDQNGRSKGSAEIEFVRKNDAVAALKKYDNVALDGRPMKMEIASRISVASRLSGLGGSTGGRLNRREGNRGRGRGRGGRGPRPNKSADQLDAEMDTYMAVDALRRIALFVLNAQ